MSNKTNCVTLLAHNYYFPFGLNLSELVPFWAKYIV